MQGIMCPRLKKACVIDNNPTNCSINQITAKINNCPTSLSPVSDGHIPPGDTGNMYAWPREACATRKMDSEWLFKSGVKSMNRGASMIDFGPQSPAKTERWGQIDNKNGWPEKHTVMPSLAPVDQLIEQMMSNVHPLKNLRQNLQEKSKSQQRNPKLIKSYVRYAAGEGTWYPSSTTCAALTCRKCPPEISFTTTNIASTEYY